MKKLPIGVATLEKIIDGNYLYIDKTMFVEKLVMQGEYYFLSRPRRFGKSLLVDTLKQAFLGNKEVFKGLCLENKWDWDSTYPVIHFSFSAGSAYESQETLLDNINGTLKKYAQKYKVEFEQGSSYGYCFSRLIENIYAKYNQKVVLLIDEYDKPILDVIDMPDQARINREILKGLYNVIKDNDQYLKFVFITGVSKFSKAGLFSGLNNLNDITLQSKYADICGYTQANIKNEFAPWMKDGKVDLHKLKSWYDGYNFCGSDVQKVYNPFDVLLFCQNDYKYSSYWFLTGTPTFLVKLFEKNQYFVPKILEDSIIDEAVLDAFDIDNIPIEALLFQTGYLTIKSETTIGANLAYVLTYPNLEVKSSLNKHLAQIGIKNSKSKSLNILSDVLNENRFDDLGEIFASHFASIPHNWYESINHYEGFYASIVYSLFCGLGYDSTPEDITNIGRMDLAIRMPDKVIIVEFKLSNRGDAVDALQQIKNRGYADKYKSLGLPIYLAGISFDPKTKNLADYKWELV